MQQQYPQQGMMGQPTWGQRMQQGVSAFGQRMGQMGRQAWGQTGVVPGQAGISGPQTVRPGMAPRGMQGAMQRVGTAAMGRMGANPAAFAAANPKMAAAAGAGIGLGGILFIIGLIFLIIAMVRNWSTSMCGQADFLLWGNDPCPTNNTTGDDAPAPAPTPTPTPTRGPGVTSNGTASGAATGPACLGPCDSTDSIGACGPVGPEGCCDGWTQHDGPGGYKYCAANLGIEDVYQENQPWSVGSGEATCPDGYKVVGCASTSAWTNSEGSYVNEGGTKCLTTANPATGKVSASSKCFKFDRNIDINYRTAEVETPANGAAAEVECERGESMLSCLAYNPGGRPLGTEITEDGLCKAYATGGSKIRATAICASDPQNQGGTNLKVKVVKGEVSDTPDDSPSRITCGTDGYYLAGCSCVTVDASGSIVSEGTNCDGDKISPITCIAMRDGGAGDNRVKAVATCVKSTQYPKCKDGVCGPRGDHEGCSVGRSYLDPSDSSTTTLTRGECIVTDGKCKHYFIMDESGTGRVIDGISGKDVWNTGITYTNKYKPGIPGSGVDKFTLQGDGNLVMKVGNLDPEWSAMTNSGTDSEYKLEMRPNRNLVLTKDGQYIWSSKTAISGFNDGDHCNV